MASLAKYIGISFIFCLAALNGFAGENSAAADSTAKTTLTFAGIYGNNASYYGQTAAQRLPYVLTNATLRFPGGLYLSAGAYKLLTVGAGVSEGDLGAGIDFDFTKNFSGSISYSYSFFPKNSPLVQASNNNSASAGLNYQWWLTTAASADYAFGEENDVFVSFSNSKSINLGSFSDKDYISLEPAVEVVGGTQRFYQTYVTKKNLKDKLVGAIFPGKGNSTTTKTVSSSSFDLLSYNFKLPLAYNRTHYIIEAAYQLSVLGSNVATTSSNKERNFYSLSIYYQF